MLTAILGCFSIKQKQMTFEMKQNSVKKLIRWLFVKEKLVFFAKIDFMILCFTISILFQPSDSPYHQIKIKSIIIDTMREEILKGFESKQSDEIPNIYE